MLRQFELIVLCYYKLIAATNQKGKEWVLIIFKREGSVKINTQLYSLKLRGKEN